MSDIWVGMTSAVAVFFILFWVGTGQVIIQKDYYDDWQECENKKTAECAPCVCRPDTTGIVWGIMGFLLMIGSYVIFYYTINKYNGKKRKTK